jgi:hypothetical protein
MVANFKLFSLRPTAGKESEKRGKKENCQAPSDYNSDANPL